MPRAGSAAYNTADLKRPINKAGFLIKVSSRAVSVRLPQVIGTNHLPAKLI